MNQDDRIEQFRKMAKANPDDDLAHYALGQALVDSERFAEAVNVLRHVIKINSGYSRAYVLLGQSLEKTDDSEGAIEIYQHGYAAAMNRGDLMPATEMKSLLSDLGAAPSAEAMLAVIGEQEEDPDDGREPEEGEVRCIRSRRIGPKMAFDPFGDDVGAFILENVSQPSWDAWMEMSIKVINELRLDLGDATGQRTYDEHMQSFLNLPAHFFADKEYE